MPLIETSVLYCCMELISNNNKNESPSAFLVAVPSHRVNSQIPPQWIRNCHFALACFDFLCLLLLCPQHAFLLKELLAQWVSIIYLCLSLFPRIMFLLLSGNSAGCCIIPFPVNCLCCLPWGAVLQRGAVLQDSFWLPLLCSCQLHWL